MILGRYRLNTPIIIEMSRFPIPSVLLFEVGSYLDLPTLETFQSILPNYNWITSSNLETSRYLRVYFHSKLEVRETRQQSRILLLQRAFLAYSILLQIKMKLYVASSLGLRIIGGSRLSLIFHPELLSLSEDYQMKTQLEEHELALIDEFYSDQYRQGSHVSQGFYGLTFLFTQLFEVVPGVYLDLSFFPVEVEKLEDNDVYVDYFSLTSDDLPPLDQQRKFSYLDYYGFLILLIRLMNGVIHNFEIVIHQILSKARELDITSKDLKFPLQSLSRNNLYGSYDTPTIPIIDSKGYFFSDSRNHQKVLGIKIEPLTSVVSG